MRMSSTGREGARRLEKNSMDVGGVFRSTGRGRRGRLRCWIIQEYCSVIVFYEVC